MSTSCLVQCDRPARYASTGRCTSPSGGLFAYPGDATRPYHQRGRRVFRLELDDAAPEGDGHRLRAVAGSELAHDVLDVHLDRLFGDEEALGDVAVAVAAGDMPEDFYLARRQRLVAQVLGKPRRDLRGDALLARVDLADGLQQLLGRGALEQISTRAGRERALDLRVALER